jgi:hypothetical protein
VGAGAAGGGGAAGVASAWAGIDPLRSSPARRSGSTTGSVAVILANRGPVGMPNQGWIRRGKRRAGMAAAGTTSMLALSCSRCQGNARIQGCTLMSPARRASTASAIVRSKPVVSLMLAGEASSTRTGRPSRS